MHCKINIYELKKLINKKLDQKNISDENKSKLAKMFAFVSNARRLSLTEIYITDDELSLLVN